MEQKMCGGASDDKEADNEIRDICGRVKASVESKTGKTYSEFTPIRYRSQVVAGTNFFVKVKVGGGEFLHLRIHQTLPYAGSTLEVSDVLEGKKEEDAIEYF